VATTTESTFIRLKGKARNTSKILIFAVFSLNAALCNELTVLAVVSSCVCVNCHMSVSQSKHVV